MTQPWMKFSPKDWRSDPRLRMCSLAARGLWIDLISYMHEGEPYGHLTINGEPPGLDDIAALVGRPVKDVEKAFDELERRQVFSVAESGAIYSRRMIRDHQRSEEGRTQIAKRWTDSPPNRGPSRSDARNDIGEPNTKKLEARDQNSESKNKKVFRAVASATRPALNENFDEFWKSYPKRKGANPKEPARKVFEAAVKQGAEPIAIIEGVRRCATADRDKIGTEFIPQAVKWLRDKRWQDYSDVASIANEPAWKQPPPGCRPLEVINAELSGAPHGEATQIRNDTGLGEDRRN